MTIQPCIDTGSIKMWSLDKAGCFEAEFGHAGKAPKSGDVHGDLFKSLHSAPVPQKFWQTPVASLGTAIRSENRSQPLPKLLEVGLAENIASEAPALVAAARADIKRDVERVLPVILRMLTIYLSPAAHEQAMRDAIVYWQGDETTKTVEGGRYALTLKSKQGGGGMGVAMLYCDRQAFGVYGDGSSASTVMARDAKGNTDLVALGVWDGRGRGKGTTAATICGDHDSRPGDQCHYVVEAFAETPVFGKYLDDGKAATLRASGGYSSGGSETLIATAEIAPFPSIDVDVGSLDIDQLAELAKATYARVGKRYLVRRLTPWECLRLQGFPDEHCAVPFRRGGLIRDIDEERAFHEAEGREATAKNLKGTMADTLIYRSAGNSMSVANVRRIVGAAEYEGGARLREALGRSHWGRVRHKARMLSLRYPDVADMMGKADAEVFGGTGTESQILAEVERELDSRFYGVVVPK